MAVIYIAPAQTEDVMTRYAIEKQLGEHMNKPPADGPDLVYAMVKIRI